LYEWKDISTSVEDVLQIRRGRGSRWRQNKVRRRNGGEGRDQEVEDDLG